jgi:L-ascorbate metabolism protein UlaG (beta-lactamase superfamily)
MLVQFVGHACWYIQAGGYNIYTDIWLENEMMGLCRRFPDFGEFKFDMPKPDYVLLTHHHWDHIIPETLLKLDKETHILCPDNWQVLTVLEKFNFKNVYVVQPWEEINLGSVKVVPTKSRVPFGEVGYYIEDSVGAVWNLCDSVFNMVDIYKMNEMSQGKLKVCLAPYQSYDELRAIMRKKSSLYMMLPQKNAKLLKHLDVDLIVPAADGLWYKDSKYMNRKSFLNTPFEFMDMLDQICPEKHSEMMMPFDELTISEDNIHINRFVELKYRKLFITYLKHRMYDSKYAPDHPRITQRDKLKPKQMDAIQEYFEYWFFEMFNKRQLPIFEEMGVRWALKILGTTGVILVDFARRKIRFGQHELLKQANCGMKIPGSILFDLIHSRQLMSILCQSDFIEVWGKEELYAHRALDALWYAGFEDSVRLEPWIDNFLEKHQSDLEIQ